MIRAFVIFLAVVMLGAFGLLIWVIWTDAHAPKLALTKAEWRCTASHTEFIPVVMMVGKVPVTNLIPDTVCDRYDRTR